MLAGVVQLFALGAQLLDAARSAAERLAAGSAASICAMSAGH